jgi:hypothetical protein
MAALGFARQPNLVKLTGIAARFRFPLSGILP